MPNRPYDAVAEHEARMNAQALADWRRRVPDPRRIPSMPSTSEMIITKYMGHADVDPPIVVTVKTVTLEDVGRDDDKEQRWFMWFHETKKGFRLNVTNIRILEAAWGMHTDLWLGKRLKLWWDPTVLFGGKPVGGVKIRLPSAGGATGATAPLPAGARFDPITGKPLGAPVQPQARFDPMTGLPLAGAAAPAPAAPPVDDFGTPAPATTPTAGIDEDFDDDIPF
jgi:hypothetical protein